MKAFVAFYALTALLSLALLAGGLFVVLHFVAKFW